MFRILASVGDDLFVGTHKGNVGVMSRCIMEDEELVESATMELTEAEPGRDKWAYVVAPKLPIWLSEPMNPESSVKFHQGVLDLKLWRYGHFLIRVGYCEPLQTWVKSKVLR